MWTYIVQLRQETKALNDILEEIRNIMHEASGQHGDLIAVEQVPDAVRLSSLVFCSAAHFAYQHLGR